MFERPESLRQAVNPDRVVEEFKVVEDVKRTELWQDLDRRVFVLSQLIQNTQIRLREVERGVLANVQNAHAGIYASMNEIQRILQALEDRLELINKLVATNEPKDIAKATVLANADLEFKNDAMHKLISDESLPPLPADQWASRLDELFEQSIIQKKRESKSWI